MDGTLTDSTTLCQSGSGNNGNEGVLHVLQNPKSGASPLDAVYCHVQHTS